MTYPSIYPTGTTVYDSSKCYNGDTVFQAKEHGSLVIDMNGGEVKLWRGLHGFPNKLLPGGQVLGHTGERSTLHGMQAYRDLIQVALLLLMLAIASVVWFGLKAKDTLCR